MASIYISSDAYQWYESGPVTDVTIRGNHFTRPTTPVIFVEPTNQAVDLENPVHRDISVTENTFDINDITLINAKSVKGLRFTANTIRRLESPAHPKYTSPLYTFTACTDVQTSGNELNTE
ncbi:hypothetical protein [Kribbella qitaiheensis]|uniref:hypothetical protein n=1 Tax=Kribbella qitaiheensis TaxID=1544730 RepID=UPI0019D6902B|nr:hypothetical protein [Kribbella qitaiheensis]